MDTTQTPIISPLTMRESSRGVTLTSVYDEMFARRELPQSPHPVRQAN